MRSLTHSQMRSRTRSGTLATALLALAPFAAQPLRAEEKPADAEIIVIHPTATTDTKQGLPNFVGISGKNAGAKHISMNKVVIPRADRRRRTSTRASSPSSTSSRGA